MRKDTGFQLTAWEKGKLSKTGSDKSFSAEEPLHPFSASIPAVTPELTYVYDGTFEGWLCCVCESYESKSQRKGSHQ